MKKTRIMCVRMPQEVLDRIDKIAFARKSWTRSYCIIQLLDVLTSCADVGTLYEMLSQWDPYGDGYKVTFKRENKL